MMRGRRNAAIWAGRGSVPRRARGSLRRTGAARRGRAAARKRRCGPSDPSTGGRQFVFLACRRLPSLVPPQRLQGRSVPPSLPLGPVLPPLRDGLTAGPSGAGDPGTARRDRQATSGRSEREGAAAMPANITEITEYVGKDGVECSPLSHDRLTQPRPGDLVQWADGRLGRVWEVGTGHCQPDEVHVCHSLGSAFLGRGYVAISGGPFTMLKRSELTPTMGCALAGFWNWGGNLPVLTWASSTGSPVQSSASIACPEPGQVPHRWPPRQRRPHRRRPHPECRRERRRLLRLP